LDLADVDVVAAQRDRVSRHPPFEHVPLGQDVLAHQAARLADVQLVRPVVVVGELVGRIAVRGEQVADLAGYDGVGRQEMEQTPRPGFVVRGDLKSFVRGRLGI